LRGTTLGLRPGGGGQGEEGHSALVGPYALSVP